MKCSTATIHLMAAAFACIATTNAQAVLLTSASGIQEPAVIDFSQFNTDTYFTATPLQLGSLVNRDVTAIGVGPFQRILVTVSFTLRGDIEWTPERHGYASSNSFGGSISFAFNDAPVRAVGGFMNYALYDDRVLVEALDRGGSVLESYDLDMIAPIDTGGGINVGEFRGIARNSADIAAFRFTGTFTLLDDLTFSQVPEPATLSLVPLGMAMLGMRRRFRAASRAATVPRSSSDISRK